jgi:hypothetical protein
LAALSPTKMSKTTPCTVDGACGINGLRCEQLAIPRTSDAKPRIDSSGKTSA